MKSQDFFEFRNMYQFRGINRESTGNVPRLGEKIIYSSGSENFEDGNEEIHSDDEADSQLDDDYLAEEEEEQNSFDQEDSEEVLEDSAYNAREVDGKDCDQDVREMMKDDEETEKEKIEWIGSKPKSYKDNGKSTRDQAKIGPDKTTEPKNRNTFVNGKISKKNFGENKNDAAFLDSLFLFENELD